MLRQRIPTVDHAEAEEWLSSRCGTSRNKQLSLWMPWQAVSIRAGFKGGEGQGARALGPPPTEGPHQTLHILFLVQIDPQIVAYIRLMLHCWRNELFFSYFTAGCTITVEYFTLIVILKYYAEYLYNTNAYRLEVQDWLVKVAALVA